MIMKYTEGDWTVQHYNNEPTPCICGGDGDIRIATMEINSMDDANLIAAAPDMLEAMKTLIAYIESQDAGKFRIHPYASEVVVVRQAIDKAEGLNK